MQYHPQTRSESPVTQDFSKLAEQPPSGFIKDFSSYLKHNKKWWLIPIILTLLLVGLLIVLGGSAAAPFIYTLF
ncbi:MAG TPA: DUF5989 family protein [Terriglobia bacterium]|nr:DUF5989 family protein [Terriglobia bacterium]